MLRTMMKIGYTKCSRKRKKKGRNLKINNEILDKKLPGGGKIVIRFYLTEGKRDAIMIKSQENS
ncbi:hypothetical protein Selli2_09970 [Sellimonas catena]|uniref:Uncharacterized protein n=1 Tax=Sellimonas catena TaxID=2994035 RepID=A0A9W6FF76_9FIRM|nr:hypothetical protein Selli2_09970 [Sellimonas catena]